MSQPIEYVIDGNVVNRLLEPYNLESYQATSPFHRILPGQVFEIMEKKFVKGLLDEIEKSKAQVVKFVNLEAIALGPHKDYLHAICGGLSSLVDALEAKNVPVIGIIQQPLVLPWNLVAKIDKNFKGIPAPDMSTPP